jgi:SecD/SecF fusion protein
VANSAIKAIILSLIVISLYIAVRFEWKFAVPVLIALMHDLLITAGVYSLTGREVTTSTVAALLTILGYSLYDTIIVFDRVRENIPRMPRAAFSQIVNRSMSEVLTRSLATSLSTLLPIAALLFFGGATLKDFAFAMMVGLASGTYSSIFIASPVLTHWKEREPAYRRRRERIQEQMGRVPAFPEENQIERLEDAPGEQVEPPDAGQPAPAAESVPPPAPPQPDAVPGPVPGVVPAPPAPVAPPAPKEPAVTGDGDGDGDGEKRELSEASAAALRRVREQQGGKKRRKHGRPR